MKETNPVFSVIVPTYNRAAFIVKTLQSVLDQTFLSFEVIVIDDGGKDNTGELVKSLSSNKVKYFFKANGERGAARNYGISKAQGQYITFLDSDDLLYPEHLQEAYLFLEKNAYPDCFAQAYEMKQAATGKILTKAYYSTTATINDALLNGNMLSCFGVFVQQGLFNEVKFEEDRAFAGSEDWLLWLQIAARYPIYFNNKVTGTMLEHDSRSVLSFKEDNLLYRTGFLKQRLSNDALFIKKFGSGKVNKIYAHMLTYTSLHLAMSNDKSAALKYLLKGVRADVSEMMTRRTLAIAKKILLS